MATIDDFLNSDFKKQSFTLDPGLTQYYLLQYSVRNSIYLESIIKSQIRLKHLLQGKGENEDNISEELSERFKMLDEEINKETMEALAHITSVAKG